VSRIEARVIQTSPQGLLCSQPTIGSSVVLAKSADDLAKLLLRQSEGSREPSGYDCRCLERSS
jgi:hypothetical protein